MYTINNPGLLEISIANIRVNLLTKYYPSNICKREHKSEDYRICVRHAE